MASDESELDALASTLNGLAEHELKKFHFPYDPANKNSHIYEWRKLIN
jgi:hypothetical protein